jgi:hypothetical protein
MAHKHDEAKIETESHKNTWVFLKAESEGITQIKGKFYTISLIWKNRRVRDNLS